MRDFKINVCMVTNGSFFVHVSECRRIGTMNDDFRKMNKLCN